MFLLLEIARGLAALWVFLFHIKEMIEVPLPYLYVFSSYGALGVPMFFVISGYVITYSAESSLKNNKPPHQFIINRFRRIYPTFWVSIGVVLILPYIIEAISFFKSGYYVFPENKIGLMTYDEWLNFFALSKVFYATSPDLQSEFSVINAVYWTLAIEFQFYLIIYACLHFKNQYRLLVALLSIACIANLVFPIEFNHGLFIHFWPSFSIGILLAYLHIYKCFFRQNLQCYLAFIICFSTGIYLNITNELKVQDVGFALLFGTVLWGFAAFEKILVRANNSNKLYSKIALAPLISLGAMSYSVYLLHGKLYQVPEMFVRQVFENDSAIYPILVILGTLFMCYPMYLYVERRFMSKNQQKMQASLSK
jgi:peptidoglycan/LPS O-acetylase OafA/YrhL